jgi:hypothetical protein
LAGGGNGEKSSIERAENGGTVPRAKKQTILGAGLLAFKNKPTSKKIGTLLAVLFISLSIYSVVNFQYDISHQETSGSIINDPKVIPALEQISSTIPHDRNTTVLVSSNAPHITLFTGLQTVRPYGVSSERSLAEFMMSHRLTYLIVIENKSDEPKLKSLFSSEGLKSLEGDFERLATYKTSYYKIHLYQLASSQSIKITSPSDGEVLTGPQTGVPLNVRGLTLSSSFSNNMNSTAKITKVEVLIDNVYPYRLAVSDSKGPNDWSTWSYRAVVTSEGIHKITVRSTDSSGNQHWSVKTVKVTFAGNATN